MSSDLDEARCDLIELRAHEATAVIAPGIGGSVASFSWNHMGEAIHWLRPATQQALLARDGSGIGCFPLVPYSNRVRNGRFAFAGREIRLPSAPLTDPHYEHGHGLRYPWSVTHLTPSSVVLTYRHKADTWPWDYEAAQEISLTSDVLTIRLSLRNLSDQPMPAGLGLHPYFPANASTRLKADVAAMWATDAEILPTTIAPLRADANPTAGLNIARCDLDNVFTGWSRRATIAWPDQGRSLDIEAQAPLDFLVLYTPPCKTYFCAEPVSNATDAFNLAARGRDDTGLFVLDPGEIRTTAVRFAPHFTQLCQSSLSKRGKRLS
ncbi:aldose 1-epimerase [Microvirga alba]|uniref:Aldose 1-epimerase n=1 Tax=Microvirga alba TaxID=2791025 RepID=A0A931FQE1_9HYPH|nr:aldose 1-epimerase [Microvirga alba]MBF9235760.1 aldose 1-epimerase [Microvirga alba]